MPYAAGDIITLELDKFYVYALIGDDGKTFYIGMTNRPHIRLYEHRRTRGNPLLRAKMDASRRFVMAILSEPLTKAEAAQLESEMIAVTPNLLNQEHRPSLSGGKAGVTNSRLPVFQQFMTHGVKTSET